MSTPTTSRSNAARLERIRAEHEARAHRARLRRRRLVLLFVGSGLAAAAILGIVIGTAHSNRQAASGSKVPPGVTSAGGIVVGSASAPLKVVIYEDPQCPVCKRFEDGNGKVLAQAVEDGKVSVEYRMRSFLGVESVRAVNALAAAEAEGKFTALHQALYADQPAEGTGGYSTDTLLDLGHAAGLTSSAYIHDVEDMAYEAWVHKTDDQGSRDGNVGTPDLRIDGKRMPVEQMLDARAFKALLGL